MYSAFSAGNGLTAICQIKAARVFESQLGYARPVLARRSNLDYISGDLGATSRLMNPLAHLYRIVTTHKTRTAAILAAMVGLGLLWATTYFDWFNQHSITKALLRELGSLLFVAVAVTLIWELAGKRAFLDEVLSRVHISQNLRQAGIEETFFRFTDIRWNELFAGVTDFEAFLSYGYTWRKTVRSYLVDLASNPRAKVQLVLPDPENATVLAELARRFDTDPEHLKNLMQESIADYDTIFSNAPCEYNRVLVSRTPLYTYYRFDRRILFALYKNSDQQGAVPALLISRGGLYEFFSNDMKELVTEH